MRRQQPAITKKASVFTVESNTAPILLNMGSSWEILRGYYLENIQELNNRLQGLNLLENAREITALCHEIIRAKKALSRLNVRTGYLA